MKTLTKILAKTCIIAGSLLALPANAQPWYGQIEYKHDSTILSAAKRTTVATQGYVMAGYRPIRPMAAAMANKPDFVIDQVSGDGIFGGPGAFSTAYQIKASATCGAPVPVYRCIGVSIVEKQFSPGPESYAIAGAYSQGVFFATLNAAGNVINTCFWPTPCRHKPVIRESQIFPGSYYIAAEDGVNGYVMRVDFLGNSIWANKYTTGRLEPRDLIESPFNSTGELIVVGLGQVSTQFGTDGFFMSLDGGSGSFNYLNAYNLTGTSSDDWFSCIEPAFSPTGGKGFVLGGRSFSPTPSNADHIQWMCKIDQFGNMVWSSLIQPGAYVPTLMNGTEVVRTYERFNVGAGGTYEYYGVAGSFYEIKGGSVTPLNNLVVFKLDDNGLNSLSPNEFHYVAGGFAEGGAIGPFADLSAIETGGGPDDGIQVYGTRLVNQSHTMAKAYFNGVSGCLDEQIKITSIFPGPQYSGSTNAVVTPINSCPAFGLNQVAPIQSFNAWCYANSVTGGSNARHMAGIQALSEAGSQMSLYPNPAKDRVTLTVPPYIKDQISVAIFNNLGQKVQEYNYANTDNGEFVIDFNALGVKGGFYTVQVSAGSLKNNYKIIYEGK